MKKQFLISLILIVLSCFPLVAQWNNFSDNLTNGKLSLRDNESMTGDIISLYGNRFNNISMYGFGVESMTTYYKASGIHRWYIGTNADQGLSAKMELNDSRLFVKGNLGIGKTDPLAKLWVTQATTGNSILSVFENTDFTEGNRSAIRIRQSVGINSGYNAYLGVDLNSHNVFLTNDDINANQLVIQNLTGNVGIGTPTPGYRLDVNGTIHAKEVKIDLNFAQADYVFKPEYKLRTLEEVEQFIKTNSHLPEIPSAVETKENGLNMGEMQNKLLQKIEELTLYTIEQNKKIEKLEQKVIELEGK
jgi:hypothetical protein